MGGFRYSARTMGRNLAVRLPAGHVGDAMPRPEARRRKRSMRNIKVIEPISLDCVIQAPSHQTEFGDYPYGGRTVLHRDPAVGGE